MNIANVMDELAGKLAALETVSGKPVRVFPYNADKVTAPAIVVALPDEIDYDLTMRRGGDTLKIDIYVFVARIDQRTGRDQLAAYLDGSGAGSVKACLDDSDTVVYDSCDTVRVATASVEPLTSGGVDYLGVIFTVEIIGQGA